MFTIQSYSYTAESLSLVAQNDNVLTVEPDGLKEIKFSTYLRMRKSIALYDRLAKDTTHGGIPAGITKEAQAKAKASIPAGTRWITIHPAGNDSKGVPVLIRESSDGTAHIVAGAGGKLNMLKLNNIMSKEHYKKKVEERKAKEKEDKENAKKAEKEKANALSAEDKKAYIASIKEEKTHRKQEETEKKEAKKTAENELIETAKTKLDWKMDDIETPYKEKSSELKSKLENAKDDAEKAEIGKQIKALDKGYERAKQAQRNNALAHAKSIVKTFQENMISDPDLRAAIEEKLNNGSGAEERIREANEGKSKGFIADYRGSAESKGLTEEALSDEAKEVFEKRMAEIEKEDPKQAEMIRKGLESNLAMNSNRRELYPEPEVHSTVADLDDKTELLKKYLKLKAVLKDTENKTIADDIRSEKFGNGVKLEYKELLGSELEAESKSIENMRQAEINRSILDKIDDNPGGIEKWIANGNYNGLNSIALQVMKTEGIDRDVSDILGIGNSAKVLGMMMRRNLSPKDYDAAAAGMESYHKAVGEALAEQANKEADELLSRADSIKMEMADNPDDLSTLNELNETRLEYLDRANQVLGQTLGSLEAQAAMVAELKNDKDPDSIESNLGGISDSEAIIRVRAIGLQKGDYAIDTVNGEKIVTVAGKALEKLMQPVSKEDIEIEAEIQKIKSGDRDEKDWLPYGIVRRPESTFVDPGKSEDVSEGSIEVQSLGENGDEIERAEESAHRTLGAMPEGRFAFSDVDDLSAQDQTDLRRYWEQNLYKGSAASQTSEKEFQTGKGIRKQDVWNRFATDNGGDAGAMAAVKQDLIENHSQEDMFGEKDLHPLARVVPGKTETYRGVPGAGELFAKIEDTESDIKSGLYDKESGKKLDDTKAKEDLEKMKAELPEQLNELYVSEMQDHYAKFMSGHTSAEFEAGNKRQEQSPWGEYVRMHGDVKSAQEAVIDHLRGNFVNKFADNYQKVTGKKLKTDTVPIRNARDHVLGLMDKEARDSLMNKIGAQISSAGATVANRAGGKFASGSWKDKAIEYLEEQKKNEGKQGALFGEQDTKQDDGTQSTTIGKRAESQLASMIPSLSVNQRRGQKFRVFPGMNMESPQHIQQQRAIKMFAKTKKMNLSFGTGKGKSITSIGAFSHLLESGKVKRGIFAVPSVVQGQFGNEVNVYAKPGLFKVVADPSLNREQRIKAMQDPANHMAVFTHQSLRDDMIHLMSKDLGIDEEKAKEQFNAAGESERTGMLKKALEAQGIKFDMLTLDESHYALNRKGKEDSTLANVIGALNQSMPYYMRQSATPVKNDASEAFDMLHNVAPEKFKDRDEFIKRYGVDSQFSRKSLQRLIDRYNYASPTDTGVKKNYHKESVALTHEQQKAYDEVTAATKAASKARMAGEVDVDAMKILSPSSFVGIPDDKREAVAANLQKSAGIIKEEAYNRVVNQFKSNNAKTNKLLDIMEGHTYEAPNKKNGTEKGDKVPGVVFARNIASIANMRETLEKKGYRVGIIQGSMNGSEKEKVKNDFNPSNPKDRKYDVILCSDAGATGLNLQNGGYLVNYDLPQTSWVKQQREGRIDRNGQAHDEIHFHDLVSETEMDQKRWDRIQRKKALGSIFEEDPGSLDDQGLAAHIAAARQNDWNEGVA